MKFFRVILAFLFGFCADICFIPGVLVLVTCWLMAVIIVGLGGVIELITSYRFRRDGTPIFNLNPADNNMQRAQARLRERIAQGE